MQKVALPIKKYGKEWKLDLTKTDIRFKYYVAERWGKYAILLEEVDESVHYFRLIERTIIEYDEKADAFKTLRSMYKNWLLEKGIC